MLSETFRPMPKGDDEFSSVIFLSCENMFRQGPIKISKYCKLGNRLSQNGGNINGHQSYN